MSRLLKSMPAGLLAVAMAFFAAAAPNLSFGAVVDHLDLRKNTKLHDYSAKRAGAVIEVVDAQLQ